MNLFFFFEGFMAVCLGYCHGISLDDEGNVWGFGENESGQIGDLEDSIPQQIKGITNIVDISCGLTFSVCVDTSGFVWSFGKNFGQFSESISSTTTPIKVWSLENIVSSSCGQRYALFLDSANFVYGFGMNRSGELGFGEFWKQYSPDKLPNIENIQQIACGDYHSILLSYSGKVYGFGSNAFGQLGSQIDSKSKEFDIQSNIVAIACGSFHTLLLSDENIIFAFGSNTKGKLGVSGTKEYKGKIILPDDLYVCKMTGGLNHSAIVDNNGELWIVGKIVQEELLPEVDSDCVCSITKVNYDFNSEIVTLSNHGNGIIVKTCNGDVYKFGEPDCGNLPIKWEGNYCNSIGTALNLRRSTQKSARK